LYLVATPIGNLEDITLRALRILREVPLVAAEDTRVTRTLWRAHELTTPLVSFHEFSNPRQRARLVERLAEGDVSLVTDAATPGITYTGYPLNLDALAAGHEVVPVPGASAVQSALIASGLPAHDYRFRGFLPRTSSQRQKVFREQEESDGTLVVFESPHRVVRALEDLVAALGPDRPVAVARELTKRFEEIFRGRAADALQHERDRQPRGEYTLVVGGRTAPLVGQAE
jgi:16S rRNA (cytidine1402-2'-O)-methyltransferase